VELQSVLFEQITELVAELAAEDTAQRVNRQEEAARGINPLGTIESQAAGGNDVVNVRMNLEVLSPGMEHAKESDVGSQVPGIASQFEHGRGAGAVEQIVEQPLVLEDQSAEFVRQSEGDVEYGTGNSSAERAASHLARSLPWHFGQCRLRHEL